MLPLLLYTAAALVVTASASPYANPDGLSKYIAAAGDTPAGLPGAAAGTANTLTTSTGNSTEPCAQVSRLVAAHAVNGSAQIDPKAALQCLRSVLLDVQGDKKQLSGVGTLVQFQSTLDLLKDPVDGYQYPGIDIVAGLERLSKELDDGSYDNEYDFQLDLYKLIQSARDEHFLYYPDITQVFAFGRSEPLYSLSSDGLEVPQTYSYRDVRALADGNSTNYTVSPIAKIDGTPVEDYLREYADENGRAQDPDANYNAVFGNPAHAASGNTFTTSAFYQGNETVLEFKNGTTRPVPNFAFTKSDFSGVVDGASFFRKFCTGRPPTPLILAGNTTLPIGNVSASASAIAKPPPASTAVPFTAVPEQTYLPAPQGYPPPWVISDDYKIACYFPEDQPDATILSVPDFHPLGDLAQIQFSNTVRSCLATAQQKQKKRLIVDLRGNGGGVVLLAFDMFKQIFPSLTPWGATNFRAFPLFNDVGRIVTEKYANVSYFNRPPLNYDSPYSSIFNANDGLDARLDDYDNWSGFYGPVEAYGASFTNLLRFNLSDKVDTSGVAIDGYGNLTNSISDQVFAAEDILLLQDGICASTCAVFSEFMKSQGHVKQVVMGGQAQTGPMQAVGGVKGANVYPAGYLSDLVNQTYQLASISERADLQAKYATAFDTFAVATTRVAKDPTDPKTLLAKVNIRNNIRQGDESLTPLQFVYEAADCRLFYEPMMILNQSLVWQAAYAALWGNGKCVEGSTGQASASFGLDYFPNGGAASESGSPSSPTPTEAAGGAPTNGTGALRSGGLVAVMLAMLVALL